MKILVCDDDHDIVDAIAVYLRNDGYQVEKAYDGAQAVQVVAAGGVSLVILDVMMPVMDGVRATVKLREMGNIPILMLSAKSEDTDKILGLNMGADDYLGKPFNPLELLARVKSQLRRYTALGSAVERQNVFRSGGLVVDDERKAVSVDGEAVRLTPMEYGILRLLTENAGRVYSIEQIFNLVWNEPAINADNTVAVHIRRIREKIEITPREPRYLKVVWGIGYKVEKF